MSASGSGSMEIDDLASAAAGQGHRADPISMLAPGMGHRRPLGESRELEQLCSSLHRFAASQLRRLELDVEANAADIVQTALCDWLARESALRRKEPWPFLCGSVRNAIRKLRRDAKRFQPLECLASEPTCPAACRLPHAQVREEMASILNALPAGQQDVLALRFVDGYKIIEISKSLGIPLGTAKSRLRKGLRRLLVREVPRSADLSKKGKKE